MHGYQLNEVIEHRLPRIAGLRPSTAYSALDRLAQRGLVTVTAERVGRRPERKVFTLTEAGRERFLALLRENLRSADLPVYAGEQGLLFARALPAAEVRELLARRLEATERARPRAEAPARRPPRGIERPAGRRPRSGARLGRGGVVAPSPAGRTTVTAVMAGAARSGLPGAGEVGRYFDAFYAALAASASFAAAGREVYGDGFCHQLGYAGDEELARLAELCGARPDARVLDLCCGLGGLAGRFASLTGARVAGVDASRAARLLAPPARGDAVQADAGRLPFRDGAFDGMICIDGFSYRPRLLARECARVLRPGGRFAFLISASEGDLGALVEEFGHAGLGRVRTEAASAVSTLKRLAAAYGSREAQLRVEIGDRLYDALAGEVVDLVGRMRDGAVVRVFVCGERLDRAP